MFQLTLNYGVSGQYVWLSPEHVVTIRQFPDYTLITMTNDDNYRVQEPAEDILQAMYSCYDPTDQEEAKEEASDG